jgi:hypothetical protein
LSTGNNSSCLPNSCVIDEWLDQTTWRWLWTHIFRNKSNCTFKLYCIKLMESWLCFVTTSRVRNKMMKIIYQANCRLGARTVVTRIWIPRPPLFSNIVTRRDDSYTSESCAKCKATCNCYCNFHCLCFSRLRSSVEKYQNSFPWTRIGTVMTFQTYAYSLRKHWTPVIIGRYEIAGNKIRFPRSWVILLVTSSTSYVTKRSQVFHKPPTETSFSKRLSSQRNSYYGIPRLFAAIHKT